VSGTILDELLDGLPDGTVRDVRVGVFWTAVVVEVDGDPRCGLASNLHRTGHVHGPSVDVGEAGALTERGGRELAALCRAPGLVEASIGLAAINALLPRLEDQYADRNAGEVIAEEGRGRRVALVGSFPFVPRLREQVGQLDVLEQRPGKDRLPAGAASEVIPRADVVAITGTSLLNHTFEELLALCRPDASILVLGPSTPLSPLLFGRGIRFLSGAIVEKIDPVLRAVSEAANFRQVRRRGVRLVTMQTAI
jgi:uncharacterized protein (DUF4213/DUF364 family)